MTESKRNATPVYTGIRKYADNEQGFGVWLPKEWRKIDLVDGRIGWIFTPNKDNFDTCFMCEKITLDYATTPEDKDILVEGFEEGIKSLPDVEILETKYQSGKKSIMLEAKFTFTEDGQRRKRWMKSLYWAEGNLVLIAQGENIEEYAYWESMLYSAMTTYELGIA
jgi:hypothetical protein